MKRHSIADQLLAFKRATKQTPLEYVEAARRGSLKDTPTNRRRVQEALALSRVRYRNG